MLSNVWYTIKNHKRGLGGISLAILKKETVIVAAYKSKLLHENGATL